MIDVLFIIALVIISMAIVCGFLMLWKIPLSGQSNKKLSGQPSISVIIPARNEEGRLQPLLESLQIQTLIPKEIIVVDDESTDRTVQLANRFGARVKSTHGNNQNWKGKSAACWIGSEVATGEWLLFLDADVRLEHKDSLQSLAISYQEQGARGILSIQPYHKVHKLYENFSAIFNIMVMAGMNLFTFWGNRFEGAGAFGPCILTTRTDYMDSGGHFVVGEAIMDDFVLATAFRKIGLPVHCLGGKDVIHFQMYPEGMKSLLEGWSKNFGTASKSTHPFVMTLISIWMSGGFLPLAMFVSAVYVQSLTWIFIALICYIGCMAQAYYLANRTGNFRFYLFIFYPILFFFFTGVFMWSLFRTKVLRAVTWKGRKIRL